jgi:hypothetical protein
MISLSVRQSDVHGSQVDINPEAVNGDRKHGAGLAMNGSILRYTQLL